MIVAGRDDDVRVELSGRGDSMLVNVSEVLLPELVALLEVELLVPFIVITVSE